MKIRVFPTLKTSFKDVWAHKLVWVKLAIGPAVVFAVGMGIQYLTQLMAPAASSLQAVLPFENVVSFLGQGAYLLTSLVALPLLEINGFRYAVLGEKNNWCTLHLNRRFVKFLVYSVLLQLTLMLCVGGAIMTWSLLSNKILAALALGAGALAALYVVFRIGLYKLLIAIDNPAPVRESWKMMDGHVLRLFAVTVIIEAVCMAPVGILAAATSFVVNPALGGIPLMLIGTFFSWALIAQAYALVYDDIRKTTPSR